jgi:hypothetical protein
MDRKESPMEFLIVDLAATIAALLGYLATELSSDVGPES